MSPPPFSSKRITVLHLITELTVGGAQRMLEKLLERMDQEKFRSLVVSMADLGPVAESIQARKIPVFTLGMRLGRPSLGGFLRLYRILREHCPEIVQTWLYHADLLGLLAGKLARAGRVVWGIRCSDMDLGDYRVLTALTVRANARLSFLPDAIVVNSEKGKEVHWKLGYSTRKMVLIENGFDLTRFHPDESAREWLLQELALPEDAILIGLVARWDPMKDQHSFLKAAALVAESMAAAHFLMVGPGMDPANRKVVELIHQGRLEGRVHLLGVRNDPSRIMAALDMACSSSAYGEGFPNTIGEAMACALPCVVTDVGDSARLVGDTGLVVPPRNPEALAMAWRELMDLGEEGRQRLGAAARRRVQDHFDLSRIVSKYESLYRSLISPARP